MTVSVVVRRRNGKRVVVRTKKKQKEVFPKPNLPNKPKVTVGAKCYGRTKRGGYIVTRFFITQWRPGLGVARRDRSQRANDLWFVADLEETSQWNAKGTKSSGYPTEAQAIKVARQYRDKYGAWTVVPF